jgi:hypothetical protein
MLLSLGFTSFQFASLNPTGTYKISNGDKPIHKVKYFGDIQVKLLANQKIAISFYVNKGAPSYNSGSFVDTLHYNNGTAYYTAIEFDPSCKITFKFFQKGV